MSSNTHTNVRIGDTAMRMVAGKLLKERVNAIGLTNTDGKPLDYRTKSGQHSPFDEGAVIIVPPRREWPTVLSELISAQSRAIRSRLVVARVSNNSSVFRYTLADTVTFDRLAYRRQTIERAALTYVFGMEHLNEHNPELVDSTDEVLIGGMPLEMPDSLSVEAYT